MIHYLNGDATVPNVVGHKIIVHICNNAHQWGAGFVMALSERWPKTRQQYMQMKELVLGDVQYVDVEDDITVANMIAQENRNPSALPPIRYAALTTCLDDVYEVSLHLEASIHMPRIGTGLAGGKWDVIFPLVQECLVGREVYVYDFQ